MNPRHGTYALLALLLIASLIFGNISSSAGTDEPASEGRPITPAGSLVQDLTTRQAAVGALPVDFVRSPDKLGPGGEGRFLIAVNSGYGIQFNATANRGQQSLSVIDLNANPPAVVQNRVFSIAAKRQCRCSVRTEAAGRRFVRALRFRRIRKQDLDIPLRA
jgi:hypothetical protein